MAVTINAVQTSDTSWLVSWLSDLGSPTYYVYQDGLLIDTTRATQKTFYIETGEQLVIEVTDDPSQVPATAFPGRLTLNWQKVSQAAYYTISEYVSAAWVDRARINDTGKMYYKWKTRFLEDSTVHQFKITGLLQDRDFHLSMAIHPLK